MKIPVDKAMNNKALFILYSHHDNELYILCIYSGFKYADIYIAAASEQPVDSPVNMRFQSTFVQKLFGNLNWVGKLRYMKQKTKYLLIQTKRKKND